MPDNSRFLYAAQRERRAVLEDRAVRAIRGLDSGGGPVTFAAVVRASGVSRSFLNKSPELAAEIRRLRSFNRGASPTVPAGQRMSDRSKDARIAQVVETNRELREELSHLREQNGILLGRLRESHLGR